MARRPILIDTDTASDDAVALIMALRSEKVDVKAVTTVAGNVSVAQATSNALYTVELCEADVPVYRGMEKPLGRKLETAHWFHGFDGLGDHGFEPQARKAEEENAITALVDIVHENRGIEIITLGPLTNIATLLLMAPDLGDYVRRVVVMGGAPCTEGNVTPAAEFNIWVDPDAAQIVFQAGLPIEMIGWQLSRGAAVVSEAEIGEILSRDTPFGNFAVASNSKAMEAYRVQTGEIGITLPDPIAMAVLLDPDLALESSCHLVEIETKSELTRGMTVVDRLNVAADERNQKVWSKALEKSSPVSVCWRLDVAGWKRALFSALS